MDSQAKWARLQNLCFNKTGSTDTLEEWNDGTESSRPKSASLPKSYEQLWEGIQRKSVDFLRGSGSLLNRSLSKDDSITQVYNPFNLSLIVSYNTI